MAKSKKEIDPNAPVFEKQFEDGRGKWTLDGKVIVGKRPFDKTTMDTIKALKRFCRS